MSAYFEKRSIMKIPRHVAIILDGNGRWAKSKGMPRTYGHTVGAKNVETICRAAWNMGIEYLTFYAFSTENWSRPDDEVKALMNLLSNYLATCKRTAKKNNMRVRVIGDITKLEPKFQEQIKEIEEYSKAFDGLNMTIAINYGSRDEIRRSVQKLADDYKEGKVTEISEELISGYLDTKELPDPDLMIRTSGEQRLSNYLLWQLAYSEFYFTETPWPAFGEDDLKKAVEEYSRRDRRFGNAEE